MKNRCLKRKATELCILANKTCIRPNYFYPYLFFKSIKYTIIVYPLLKKIIRHNQLCRININRCFDRVGKIKTVAQN